MHQHEQSAAQSAKSRAALWAVIITSVAGFMAALDNLVVTTALPTSATISVAPWRISSGR